MGPNRGHDPDSQLRRAEPGVDVHAADEEPPHLLLVRDLGLFVSPPRRDPLLVPPCKGMGGGGDERGAVPARPVDDDASGLAEARMQLGDGRADPGAGLDLGPEELVDDLVRPAVGRARLEDGRVGIGDGVAGVRVHDHQLFFDSEGQVHGSEVAVEPALRTGRTGRSVSGNGSRSDTGTRPRRTPALAELRQTWGRTVFSAPCLPDCPDAAPPPAQSGDRCTP